MNQASDAAISGVPQSGMDRVRVKSNKKSLWILVPTLFTALLIYIGSQQVGGRSLNVSRERIVTSQVKRGIFEDFIPLRARVIPAKTLYLDAVEGGRVERVFVEDGALLKQGELIAELSNAQLQLNVLSNEARVAEQLNNIRSIELRLQQNRLQHKSNLVDIEYQIKMLNRKVAAEKTLLNRNSVSRSQYEDTRDSLHWYQQRRELTLESQASDNKMQQEQLRFLQETAERLQNNLALSRKNLENMRVRAPVAGKLSGFDIEVGQSIGNGERLGQIDTPNAFKASALIDEFYLERVDLEQRAQLDHYQLRISKIYPQVQNGQFEVEFSFVGNSPSNIRRGQSLPLKLTLSDASQALLIPNGAFFQDTRGSWIFVVDQNRSEAHKRQLRLGRRNSHFIEVLEGLEEGEQVITSPYSNYLQLEKLHLTEE